MQLQIGVKLLIKNNEDAYLLLQRTDVLSDNVENAWDIPGGRINPSEDLQTALDREIQEETGVTLTATPELLAAQDIFATNRDLHVVRLTYRVDADPTDIILSHEHQAYRWVSLEDALILNVEPYLKKVLQQLT